ncbi:MAG: radical SAM family heme chaperone HemW [Pseudomonadota bacterium]
MREFTEYPPLSLYVHFPWCVRKCPYCDFNSHNAPQQIPEQQYLDALIADLERHAPDIWGRPVETIFIGGGTPSLLSESGFDYLLSRIRALVRLEPEAEITLEANPGTVDQARFQAYRQAGANRLSIGVQSFDDQQLKTLGRIHGSAEAIGACEAAVVAGFDNFNIDLMHGLPAQTLQSAGNDVSTAISLNPTHISYYQLTLEPNTLFAAKPPVLPDDDALWQIQQAGRAQLAESGYQQYEVSAYASAKRQCRHNLNYWLFGDYLGIGAGAHSKLTFPAHATITRIAKQKHPATYMQTAQGEERIQQRHDVDRSNAYLEFLMNALRLNDGFTRTEFQQRVGEPISAIAEELRHAEQLALVQRDSDIIRPTEKGLQYLNTLLEIFLHIEAAPELKAGSVIPIVPAGPDHP